MPIADAIEAIINAIKNEFLAPIISSGKTDLPAGSVPIGKPGPGGVFLYCRRGFITSIVSYVAAHINTTAIVEIRITRQIIASLSFASSSLKIFKNDGAWGLFAVL